MIGMVFAAIPAAAQDTAEPLTWLLSVTVKPGKVGDLEKAAQKYDKPVFDKLVADGSITSYGLARRAETLRHVNSRGSDQSTHCRPVAT